MQKLTPILALATALLASSCVYESRAPRYAPVSRPVNIWDQQSVDDQTRAYYPYSDAARLTHTGIYPSPQGGYRLYTGASGIPDTTRLYNPGTYSRRDDRGASSGYASTNASAEERRLTGPSTNSLTPRREILPSSRSSLPEANEPWRRRAATTRSQSAADQLASANNTQRQPAPRVPEPAPRSNREISEAPVPAEPAKLPFAQPVPGRVGYVKLSDHPNLPEIDVRGIAPGTPVEVPNPATSGETIQFRVP